MRVPGAPCRSRGAGAPRGEPDQSVPPEQELARVGLVDPGEDFLSRVDFPAPFSPTSVCTSPGWNVMETPESTTAPSNDFVSDVPA